MIKTSDLAQYLHLHRVHTALQLIRPDQEGAAGSCLSAATHGRSERMPDQQMNCIDPDEPVRVTQDYQRELGMWPDCSD